MGEHSLLCFSIAGVTLDVARSWNCSVVMGPKVESSSSNAFSLSFISFSKSDFALVASCNCFSKPSLLTESSGTSLVPLPLLRVA